MKKKTFLILFSLLTLSVFTAVGQLISVPTTSSGIVRSVGSTVGTSRSENETDNHSSTLQKFRLPTPTMDVDYSLVCVDSVWYDPVDPTFIHVRVYNGDSLHLNYPSVQMVSSTGDTISNVINWVTYFAQLAYTYTEYVDTILVQGITDFSEYTFVMNEGFGDSSGVIGWCSTVGIDAPQNFPVVLYPNPASKFVFIQLENNSPFYEAEILTSQGNIFLQKNIRNENTFLIDISGLSSGMYFVRLKGATELRYGRFIKE